jgi:hypothetical protein
MVWVVGCEEASLDGNRRQSGHDGSHMSRTSLYVAQTSSARSLRSEPNAIAYLRRH